MHANCLLATINYMYSAHSYKAYQSRKYLPVLTWKVVTERLAMSCIPLGAQKKATAQHQAEAHSDGIEQQRCVESGPQDKGSAGHVGLPGAQELGLFKEDLRLGKCVPDNI